MDQVKNRLNSLHAASPGRSLAGSAAGVVNGQERKAALYQARFYERRAKHVAVSAVAMRPDDDGRPPILVRQRNRAHDMRTFAMERHSLFAKILHFSHSFFRGSAGW